MAGSDATEGQAVWQPGGAEEDSRLREGNRHLRLAYEEEEEEEERWLVLVFVTRVTSSASHLNSGINTGPVDSGSCQLLHSFHAEVSEMPKIQDLGLQALWNHNSRSMDEASVAGTE